MLFLEKTLIGNMKHEKISFNNISVKNQQINTIIKNDIEFLMIKDIFLTLMKMFHILYI